MSGVLYCQGIIQEVSLGVGSHALCDANVTAGFFGWGGGRAL